MKPPLLCLGGIAGIALLFSAPVVGLATLLGVLCCVPLVRRMNEVQPTPRNDATPPPQLSTRAVRVGTPVLVPVFTGQEPLDALVPLAWRVGGGEPRVHVVWIEEVPCKAPFWRFGEHNAQALLRFMRASKGMPSCTFEGVLTHRSEELLLERASEPETGLVVLCRERRSSWRRVFDPLARFITDPPCRLAVYTPAVSASSGRPDHPQRILVVAGHRSQDTLLLEVASRLATRDPAHAITVAYQAPLEASREELLAIHDYNDGLLPLGVPARVHIVCSSEPLETLVKLSERFDVLVLGRSRPRGLGWLGLGFNDRLAQRASCAVIQLSEEARSRTGRLRSSVTP